MDLRPIELRVLQYLEQRGGQAERQDIVMDLAHPDSKIHKVINSSGGHLAMICGKWVKRMVDQGLIQEARGDRGWYKFHRITLKGREAIRAKAHNDHYVKFGE